MKALLIVAVLLLFLTACIEQETGKYISIHDAQLYDLKHQLPGDGRNCKLHWVENETFRIVACDSWASTEVSTTLFECEKDYQWLCSEVKE